MPDLSKLSNLAGELRDLARPHGPGVRATSRREWYSIKNVASGRAEVYLYDMIGYDPWDGSGISALDFVNDLRGISSPIIDLHINSKGGEVWDGIAIYECLKQHPARVEVNIDALAASAASYIAMSGDVVRMARNARMMIHEASIGGALGAGNAADMREFAVQIEKLAERLEDASSNIADIYAQRAGGSAEDWRAKMVAETWFSPNEARALGLIDEIVGETPEAQTTPVESTTATDEVDVASILAALKGAWDA